MVFNKAPMMVELKQQDSIIDAEIIPSASGLIGLNGILVIR
jgi:hypothetical protein